MAGGRGALELTRQLVRIGSMEQDEPRGQVERRIRRRGGDRKQEQQERQAGKPGRYPRLGDGVIGVGLPARD